MGLLDLFRKKTQFEIFRDEIERTYKNAVMTAIKQCGGNELIRSEEHTSELQSQR